MAQASSSSTAAASAAPATSPTASSPAKNTAPGIAEASPAPGASGSSTPSPAAASPEEDDEESAEPVKAPASPQGIIDMEVFQQIQDMDDEEDEDDEDGDPHAFSRGIVWGYFEQAEETFDKMKRSLATKDLPDLSGLGHFLKGSSAALGIIKVQASCEKMQHYGARRDEEAGEALSEDEALRRIAALLKVCRKDYEVAKAWLVKLYSEE